MNLFFIEVVSFVKNTVIAKKINKNVVESHRCGKFEVDHVSANWYQPPKWIAGYIKNLFPASKK
jgi:hypothetical protein